MYARRNLGKECISQGEIWGKSLRRGTPLLKGRGRVWEGVPPSQTPGEVLRYLKS